MRGVQQNHAGAVAEADNLRAALGWALGTSRLELAARLATSLENFWVTQDPVEGGGWISALLERGEELPPDLLPSVVRCLGSTSAIAGYADRVSPAYKRALALYRERGDDGGVATLPSVLSAEKVRADNARRPGAR